MVEERMSKLPNKMKVFVWRACLNALPKSLNLNRRIPGLQVICPFCNEEGGCLAHSSSLGLGPTINSCSLIATFLTVVQWMKFIASQLDAGEFDLFLFLCWSIWWCRNRKLKEEKCLDPSQGLCFASHFLDSFLLQASGSATPGGSRSPTTWLALPPNFIKVNLDGATFDKGKEVRIGVIARDANGIFVALSSRWLARVGNGELAEALAARKTAQLVLQRGWRLVVLESDCANLTKMLQAPGKDLFFVNPIVSDVCSLVSCLLSCRFSLVKRSANSVGHFLAQSTQDYGEGDLVLLAVAVLVSLGTTSE
ncbi:UNVERIFIED_CONTAM: hypothetical protein Slati_3480500 [Sesamum latifolium]|uniref:RNase H type-1 domain-containing protein n=1 Tax=Sesamum latifolium TaxID=2727402 RepID=A0AAW2UMC5_9LAMI